MNPNILKIAQNIYFIGVGGIGISAVARMMILENKKVSGSDKETDTTVIKELKKLGAKIYKNHSAKNVRHAMSYRPDLVIYTNAIPTSNPELKKVKKLNIPCLSYPQALGFISKDKYTIAVSGCHGKTTTTAMVGKILMKAKKDPTIIVGSLLKEQKSNFIAGKSKPASPAGGYLVCEACEYKKAFLNLFPKVVVITNIDNDHLDYYKNLKNIQTAFSGFVSKLGKNDYLICDKTDKNSLPIIKTAKCKIIDFSKIKFPKNFKLKVAGEHNIKNAKAALAVAKILEINKKIALSAVKGFNGTWRRFEYKGKTKNNVSIYDDYAHHPTEIKATLKTARDFFGDKKIWCVFQPHLYSRTRFLLNDFAKSFNNADFVIVAPIYAAREKNDKKISSNILAEKIKKYNPNTIYFSAKGGKKIENFLKKNVRKNDIVITMGAGDIFKIGENLMK